MSGQYKWNLESGESHVVGSPASDRPVRPSQANLFRWAEETRKWNDWVARDMRGPQDPQVLESENRRQLRLGESQNTPRAIRCAFCGSQADYQAVTSSGYLSYVCQRHFASHGCLLARGSGSRRVEKLGGQFPYSGWPWD